jgi:ectoine hydroxylase-related dioxygenase (phytanoyl-CoA dioxygenase family)
VTDPGYWIEEDVLSTTECEALITELSKSKTRHGRAGQRHLMSNPTVAALAQSNRLCAIARQMLGDGAVPFRATLFEKAGYANWLVVWHQDTALPLTTAFNNPDWGPWSVKEDIRYAHAPTWAMSRVVALRVHLDASTSENGPLRVIPGSHLAGVLTDEEVANYAHSHQHAECLVKRGGVLGMRPLLIHSSSKARSAAPRRVLHIEYADSLQFADNIQLAIA